MKFISVRDLRTRPASIWKELKKERELVITNNGKPIALMTPLSDRDMEETLRGLRRSRAAEALARMRTRAAERGTASMTADDIEREIRKQRFGK